MVETKKETLEYILVGKHHFKRYLFDNKYAEEMKCTNCGFVIWSCYSTSDAVNAVGLLGGKLDVCPKK